MRKSLIAGSVLALALAATLALPGWLGAAEQSPKEPTADGAPGHGFLGVGLRQLTPELQTHFGAPEGSGVLVASVTADGPAAAAGIRVGDVITAVDGLAVDSSRDLGREVRHRPGEMVEIELYRDGARQQVGVTLGQRQAHHWDHGRSAEEWADLAEHWESWGEEFGEGMERWGEEFGERWGQEFGERMERWGEEFGQKWGEEFGEKWGEEMAERGQSWEEMGQEIGRAVEQALREVDWEAISRSVEESMRSLEELDLESMGVEIERHMEELERHLEEQRSDQAGAD